MWLRGEGLDTTVGRAATGLVVGSATGTIVTLLGFLGMALVGSEEPPPIWQLIPSGMVLAIPVFIVWLIGAFTLGAGGWAILHSLRLRGGLAAAFYGGGLNLLVGLGLTSGRSLPFAAFLSGAGVLAGLAVWRFSYRVPRRPVGEAFA